MDMVIFWTIFFELLVFFTITLLTLHSVDLTNLGNTKTRQDTVIQTAD